MLPGSVGRLGVSVGDEGCGEDPVDGPRCEGRQTSIWHLLRFGRVKK